MRCLRCGECCKETEMLLSNQDIERLEKRGYARNSFVRFDEQGYATLKNVGGNCYFFDSDRVTCRERANRPLGCRIYPVMLDEDRGIVVDDFCSSAKAITEKQKAKRGKDVTKLLKRIDSEAEQRRLRRR